MALNHLASSVEHWLQLISVDPDCRILIDQFECQHEPHFAAPFDNRALNALHDAALDSHCFANNEFVKWLNSLSVRVGPQQLDLCIADLDIFSAVPHDLEHSRGLENRPALS